MSRRHSFKLILALVTLILFSACATQMSLEEAKKVTLSTGQKSFTPPPRRINDVLSVLNQPGQFNDTIARNFQAKADASPPKGADESTLASFYYNRGLAAMQLGRSRQAIEDFRAALQYGDKVPDQQRLLSWLAKEERLFGNYRRALDLAKKSRDRKSNTGSGQYPELVRMYLDMGDHELAQEAKAEGSMRTANCSQRAAMLVDRYSCSRFSETLEYLTLEARGKYAEAESNRRKALYWAGTDVQRREYPVACINERAGLALNLLHQGRMVDAELEAREALKEAIGLGGKDSEAVTNVLMALGGILMRQGRLGEAEEIFKASIRIMGASGVPPYAGQQGIARMAIGNILVARQDYGGAMKQFDQVRDAMRENEFLYKTIYTRNLNLIIALLKAGRTDEAKENVNRAYEMRKKSRGEKHPDTLEVVSLRAMAHAAEGRNKSAYRDFFTSIPSILEQNAKSTLDYDKKQRLKVILESYLDFLAGVHGTPLEKEEGVQANEEAFKVANTLGGQALYGAVGESSARAAASRDPELADLVRREQDTQKEIAVLDATLSNLSAAPADQQLTKSMKEIKDRIDTLTKARSSILAEIGKRFPKYNSFVNPSVLNVSDAQSSLHAGETLALVYSLEDKTLLWAIPHKGKPAFHASPLGRKEISQAVASLRKSLDPERITLGEIPDFDVALAYKLYNGLFKPVEGAWKDSSSLLFVVSGPLGQLPLSVLPTEDIRLRPEQDLLFSRYRQVPWLIRKAAITMLPSVSSLITFRSVIPFETQRKAFLGFGDPIFNKVQLAQVEAEEGKKTLVMASRGGGFHLRGVRITANGNLDNQQILSSQLTQLDRLPDTAEEIRSVAQALDADLEKDIFLRKKASVRQVKDMNLSDRRVISFATHALVPGDVDGLDQPALALSSPIVTGDDDDGLLTMGEILKLKMNADWVILSACNTAAAEGTGAEALSGLVRAFFYAGTRSILASMYPVESTSAKNLVTGIFQYQKKDKNLSRSGALQKSMLALIDETNLVDETTGRMAASYAHPLFWAPFIVVGEPNESVVARITESHPR